MPSELTSVSDLKKVLVAECHKPHNHITNLVESLPKRVGVVLTAQP